MICRRVSIQSFHGNHVAIADCGASLRSSKRPVLCLYGCGRTIQAADMEKHVLSGACVPVRYSCPLCGSQPIYTVFELADHHVVCPGPSHSPDSDIEQPDFSEYKSVPKNLIESEEPMSPAIEAAPVVETKPEPIVVQVAVPAQTMLPVVTAKPLQRGPSMLSMSKPLPAISTAAPSPAGVLETPIKKKLPELQRTVVIVVTVCLSLLFPRYVIVWIMQPFLELRHRVVKKAWSW